MPHPDDPELPRLVGRCEEGERCVPYCSTPGVSTLRAPAGAPTPRRARARGNGVLELVRRPVGWPRGGSARSGQGWIGRRFLGRQVALPLRAMPGVHERTTECGCSTASCLFIPSSARALSGAWAPRQHHRPRTSSYDSHASPPASRGRGRACATGAVTRGFEAITSRMSSLPSRKRRQTRCATPVAPTLRFEARSARRVWSSASGIKDRVEGNMKRARGWAPRSSAHWPSPSTSKTPDRARGSPCAFPPRPADEEQSATFIGQCREPYWTDRSRAAPADVRGRSRCRHRSITSRSCRAG